MPDWTYHPLAPIASAVLGERRTQLAALRLLAGLIISLGGRRWIPWVFDHPVMPQAWEGRFGASVPPSIAVEAVTVLPVQGASVVELDPVGVGDVDTVARATVDRRCLVRAVATTAEVGRAVAPFVDEVLVGSDTATIRLTSPDVDAAVEALGDPSAIVLATPAVLIAAGPGWFNRVIEAATPTSAAPTLRDVGPNPLRWPGWFWAILVGLGLIVAGVGAATITLGPVLLPYDRDYLGSSVTDLDHLNAHLIGFLRHDRLTMASNMIGLGVLYTGLAWGGIRQGYRWARRTLLISGLVAFLTWFYFLATGFVEPLHTLVVAVLFPMLLVAVWRAPARAGWPPIVQGPESQRRRALWGQLLMIGVGGGLCVAGATISVVGLTGVFVMTDLMFLHTGAARLQAANPHLLPFIAHDRAGFGGALMGSGLAVLLISLWGWRRGARWVWWSLLVGCFCGTAPVLAIHLTIGYTHLEHLLPVYVLVLAVACALALSRGYLTASAKPGRPVHHRAAGLTG